jgi:glycerophosphoryl diester phosphodiesterase
MKLDSSRFVAHRGYAFQYPENTLLAMKKAVEAGALFLECDIQLTADHIPVVHHDGSLSRSAGTKGQIMDFTLEQLTRLSFGEPGRFGDKFSNTSVTTLKGLVSLLAENPNVNLFVEIKEESIDKFGARTMIKQIFQTVKPALDRCIAISFATEPLKEAMKLGWKRTGWVLPHFEEKYREQAEALSPEFLFCDHEEIPQKAESLWKGNWKWVLYEVAEAGLAEKWIALGADMIETMRIGEMIGESRKREG